MSVIVNLALATICFTYGGTEECHPVLLGKAMTTPAGQYQIARRLTYEKGYGGDVLQFLETEKEVYAIHRVWTMIPAQKRIERLKSPNVKDRFISGGCINVDPEIFDKLVACCSNATLTIK